MVKITYASIALLAIGVIVVIIGFPIYAKHKLFPFLSFGGVYTTDEGTSVWMIAGHRFAIPDNYIMTGRGRGGGKTDQVNLETVLPNMDGYTEDNKNKFNCRGHCDKVSISIYRSRANKSIAHRVRCHQAQLGVTISDPPICDGWDAAYLSYDEDKREDYYFFDKDGRYYMVMCSKDGIYPSPGCRVSTDYSNNIVTIQLKIEESA